MENVLKTCMACGQTVNELTEYQADAVVSKTIVNKEVGTVTIFAFDKGQSLSPHAAAYDAIVMVTDGQALITIDGKEHTLKAGELIIMPANVTHSVAAIEKFKMMLIMIRQ